MLLEGLVDCRLDDMPWPCICKWQLMRNIYDYIYLKENTPSSALATRPVEGCIPEQRQILKNELRVKSLKHPWYYSLCWFFCETMHPLRVMVPKIERSPVEPSLHLTCHHVGDHLFLNLWSHGYDSDYHFFFARIEYWALVYELTTKYLYSAVRYKVNNSLILHFSFGWNVHILKIEYLLWITCCDEPMRRPHRKRRQACLKVSLFLFN